MSPTHSDMYPNQVNIIHKKNYKKTHFTPNVEWIKLDYFSSRNNTKRAYFQTLLPQASNALRKQYEKYMNQKKMKIHFFHWFFLLRKQIITLRNEEGHQLGIKHLENIQKRILIITSKLGSNPPLNNHQFTFDNNLISVSPFKIPRTNDEQSPVIYKDIRQVQQQLNYKNHSSQHLTQQTTKISQFLFSSALGGKIEETSKSKKHQNQLFLQNFL